jgi:acetolactate synthase-1/3 small subunit
MSNPFFRRPVNFHRHYNFRFMSTVTQAYTITVFTEDQTGLLSRVVGIFNRRNINIDSLTTSASSDESIHRFTIVVQVTQEMVEKLIAQLDKQVDVLKAFYTKRRTSFFRKLHSTKSPPKPLTMEIR